MISALIRYARENGIGSGPYWVDVKAKVIDLGTGAITDEIMPCHKRQRSGTLGHEKPGIWIEKGKNLQPGKKFRESFVAAHDGTAHPLARAIVKYLEEGGACPTGKADKDDPYVTFRLNGQDLRSDSTLRTLADPILDRDQGYLPKPGTCTECGAQGPIVDLHRNGLAELHAMAPILVSWSRKPWGGKKEGENLPMCVTCMRLYTNAINALVRDYGQSWRGGKIFPLYDDGVLLGSSNSCAWVEEIIPGIGQDLRDGVEVSAIFVRRGDVATILDLIQKKDTNMIEQEPAPSLSCPGTKCGELYAYLEHALKGTGKIPDMTAAMANPRVIFVQAIPAARTAMLSDKGDVQGWFRKLLTAGVEGLKEFPAKLTEEQKGRFLIAYCQSVTRRAGGASSYIGVTPWQERLANALVSRGLTVAVEYNEWASLTDPEPADRPLPGQKRAGYYRIDIALVSQKIAIEVDGRLRGEVTRNFEDDNVRAMVLTLKGWHLIRVANGNLVTDEDVNGWADMIVSMINARSASA